MADSLYEQFSMIAAGGDEQAAKDFLIDHLKEFPEALQNKIIAAFAADALQKRADDINEVAALQRELLEALKDTENAEQIVADKKKELELKEELNK